MSKNISVVPAHVRNQHKNHLEKNTGVTSILQFVGEDDEEEFQRTLDFIIETSVEKCMKKLQGA